MSNEEITNQDEVLEEVEQQDELVETPEIQGEAVQEEEIVEEVEVMEEEMEDLPPGRRPTTIFEDSAEEADENTEEVIVRAGGCVCVTLTLKIT